MMARDQGSQQLHHERQAAARTRAALRVRRTFDKAMEAIDYLRGVIDDQHHDTTLVEHLPALDAHINAVYQDVLVMEREARAESGGRDKARQPRSGRQ